ncbi:MAG: kelch repeat-containing protein [Kofleriaceae bacterium]
MVGRDVALARAGVTALAVLCACGSSAGLPDARLVDDAPFTDAEPGPDAIPAVPVETTIDAAPAALSATATATFEFSASRPASFLCRLDGGAPSACASPLALTGLAEGDHAFAVHAIADDDGVVDGTPATHSWRVDTTPPETTLVFGPGAIDNTPSPQIDCTADEADTTYECALDGGAFTPCTCPVTVGPLADGLHELQIRAVDAAGNVDPSPLVISWELDTSTPDTQIDSGPAGIVASASASFEFSSPNAGGGATFACAVDGGGFAACTSPLDLVGLAEGGHTFAVAVTNAALTTDPTPAARTWTVDTVPPTVMFTSGPSGPTTNPSPSFTFTVTGGPATTTCAIDGAVAAACGSPMTTPTLGAGAHTIVVTATDAAGNAGNDTRGFSVVAPVWTLRTPATSPPARQRGHMAYDAARAEVVLFGGDLGGTRLNDTWIWNGATWIERTPATSPTAYSQGTMGYDAGRQRVVLFGGLGPVSNVALATTWLWDGTTWTLASPATSPPRRTNGGMAYDANADRLVLFAGRDPVPAPGFNLADTWLWDGTTWTAATPAISPPARVGHSMAYDARNNVTTIFGGTGGTTETWIWDGVTWSELAPTPRPSGRYSARLVDDLASGRLVLFGGTSQTPDTWRWDGGTWDNLAPPLLPTARYRHVMAYDAARAETVVFGGTATAGGALLGDTWVLSAP